MHLLMIGILILILSFILAVRSMADFEIPKEVRRLLKINKVKGTIMFLKGKVKHYRN